MSARRGVLLCNIGTPDSYRVDDVAKYLKEFLMDEEILTLPFLARYFLVHLLIVPKRAAISAKNYEAIWTEEGSPLRVLSETLKTNLRPLLQDAVVEVGMRYGRPSVEESLAKFKEANVEEVVVVPLYPQFARATTVSTRKKVEEVVRACNYNFRIRELAPFFDDAGFVEAVAETARASLQGKTVDHYLMTYHGLPESQVRKTAGCLRSSECCSRSNACEVNCYRAQCFQTSALVAKALDLKPGQWTVSFQSRLGRTEWIKPYTDVTLLSLPGQGVKSLAVLCPSFISDCLETLEEIGVQGRKLFLHSGGEDFHLVPCLNERADYLAALIDRA